MKHLLITTALVAFAAAPLAAQTATTTTDPAATTGAMATPTYMSGNMEISADKLIGMNVYMQNPDRAAAAPVDPAVGVASVQDNWDDVGNIGDVLVSADGQVNSIVVDVGGFLGMGERKIDVAMDQLQFVPDTANNGEFFVVYTGDRAQLEGAAPFDQSAMTDRGLTPFTPMSNANADATATTGTAATGAAATDTAATGAAATDTAATGTAATGTAATGTAATGTTPATDPTMMRPDRSGLTTVDATTLTADDLKGARVYGTDEQWVGEISELVLADDGTISDAVVDVGGWLGIGERPVALKFSDLDVRRDANSNNIAIYVDYTEDQLKAMPEYQK